MSEVEDVRRDRRGVTGSVRALLADGTAVRLRELADADAEAVAQLHRELPVQDRYLRFFSAGTTSGPPVAERPGSAWIGAFRGAALVGVAEYTVGDDPAAAEVALAVGHPEQAHGVGTLLLEHLASLARHRGLRRFTARVLAENTRMRRVFADLGLPVRTVLDRDELAVEVDLNPDARYLDALAERQQRADVASLQPMLRPRSVVVVGASRRGGSVGNAVLRSILAGGFTGTVAAVNPHAAEVEGVPCHRSVTDLPLPCDLAVVCVPAAAVPAVARECGERGVRALLVISSGLSGDDPGPANDLVEVVRQYDMRLVGPNCLGLSNSDPAVRLDGGFAAPGTAAAGEVGLVSQSGGVTIAVQDALRRLGTGTSTAVSTGDKYDVSGNDMLLWWRDDLVTRAAVLYLESFGNPRRFSRFARRLAARIPVLTVRSGSSEAGRRAASHTAATATPRVVRDALFRQAGVSALDRLSEVPELLALLLWQPLPAGRRVAVISNAGGAGVLTADACVARGLPVPPLAAATRHALARVLPSGAAVGNPVDTTAVVAPAVFADAVRVLLADPGIDAVVAVTVPTALGDPGDGIAALAAGPGRTGTPLLAVRPTQPENVVAVGGAAGRRVPCFADAAAAAAALAHAVTRAEWLARPAGAPWAPAGTGPDLARAAGVVSRYLGEHPAGGWLPPDGVEDVLEAFGIPVLRGAVVDGPDAAVRAFAQAGGPVALKAVADGVLHKAAAGGVRLGLDSSDAVGGAARDLVARFGGRLRGLLVQPMTAPGPELLVGVTADPAFGPLVTVGLGGGLTDLVADRAHRLVPLTPADVGEMLGEFRAGAALFSPDARQAIDGEAVRDAVLRVGQLAELLPEVAELDLNPLVASARGCVAVDARIRVEPAPPGDPATRALRI
ncbi:bifunctional acetate--CoA ligase family protein/GNAT family N-acetyltransferase [Pseudonocardia hydrocarbonoxydans]|uniref:bifunctional acetate--CoA ligase family protein/GNAT family N-acetyltransferase n=1 Tax=Pseudonocardia hydrocarbonoxydans TaxID=76726 RepID=UPI0031D1C354